MLNILLHRQNIFKFDFNLIILLDIIMKVMDDNLDLLWIFYRLREVYSKHLTQNYINNIFNQKK